MHSRQTIHLPSGSSAGDHHVQPAPLHARQRSFSAICLSVWAIAAEHTGNPTVSHSIRAACAMARKPVRELLDRGAASDAPATVRTSRQRRR